MMTDFMAFKASMIENKKAFGAKEAVDASEVKAAGVSMDDLSYFERFSKEDPDDSSTGWNKTLTFESKEPTYLDSLEIYMYFLAAGTCTWYFLRLCPYLE